jgi:hypothetical protein
MLSRQYIGSPPKEYKKLSIGLYFNIIIIAWAGAFSRKVYPLTNSPFFFRMTVEMTRVNMIYLIK